ncbi:MAG: radical SAM protein, partial [Clostridia bacterium]|nr:radical SAM protein [Clostridia bacterium]
GVSSMTFTGGECTIHPDFLQLYEYAYNKGLQVGMISNGSMITDEILQLFERCPPSKIYITLYGMSKETYARNCGNGAAFDAVMQNLDALLERKFTVILNYTAGKENLCDLEAALAYARERKISILPTSALNIQNKCDQAVLDAQLADYYEYQKIEHQHLSILRGKSLDEFEKGYFSSFSDPIPSESKQGLSCNAGRCSFTVNWKGEMKSCANFDLFTVDPRKTGMQAAWEQLVAWADQVPILEECETCIFQQKCRRCVAIHYGDMGEFGKVSPRFCFKKLYPEQAAKMQAKYDEMKANGEIEE